MQRSAVKEEKQRRGRLLTRLSQDRLCAGPLHIPCLITIFMKNEASLELSLIYSVCVHACVLIHAENLSPQNSQSYIINLQQQIYLLRNTAWIAYFISIMRKHSHTVYCQHSVYTEHIFQKINCQSIQFVFPHNMPKAATKTWLTNNECVV